MADLSTLLRPVRLASDEREMLPLSVLNDPGALETSQMPRMTAFASNEANQTSGNGGQPCPTDEAPTCEAANFHGQGYGRVTLGPGAWNWLRWLVGDDVVKYGLYDCRSASGKTCSFSGPGDPDKGYNLYGVYAPPRQHYVPGPRVGGDVVRGRNPERVGSFTVIQPPPTTRNTCRNCTKRFGRAFRIARRLGHVSERADRRTAIVSPRLKREIALIA